MNRAHLAHPYEPVAEAHDGDAMDDAVLTAAIVGQLLEALRATIGLAEMLAKRVASD